MIEKDLLLTLIAEEKERFSNYSQLCSQYLVSVDPKAQARSQGKLECLNQLLKLSNIKI